MVDIVRRMGWSYISIIYEESNYGIKVNLHVTIAGLSEMFLNICTFRQSRDEPMKIIKKTGAMMKGLDERNGHIIHNSFANPLNTMRKLNSVSTAALMARSAKLFDQSYLGASRHLLNDRLKIGMAITNIILQQLFN